MVRAINPKHLKRVSGEVQLAQVKLDCDRPTTSGIPLKRCDNETTTSFAPEASLLNQYICEQPLIRRPNKSGTSHHSKLSNPFVSPAPPHIRHTQSSSSPVPASSTHPPSTLSETPFATPSRRVLSSISNGSPNAEVFYMKNEQKKCSLHQNQIARPPPNDSIIDDCSSCGQPLSKFASSIGTTPVGCREESPFEEVIISTATSLNLPQSNNGDSTSIKSSLWSIKNNALPTPFEAQSTADGGNEEKVSEATNESAPTTTTGPTECGDGDSASTAVSRPIPGSKEASTSSTPQAPPASGTKSISDQPPFVLTFRKPKPRLRSIITSKFGGDSLPSTASTPNPVASTPPRALTTMMHRDDNNNNNNDGPAQNEVNNNDIEEENKGEKSTNKDSKENVLPKYVFSLEKVAEKDNEVQVMPAQQEHDIGAGVDFGSSIQPIAMAEVSKGNSERDESFWRSDSSPEGTVPLNQHGHRHHHQELQKSTVQGPSNTRPTTEDKGAISQTDITDRNSNSSVVPASYPGNNGSSYVQQYNPYGYPSKNGQNCVESSKNPYESDAPFLRTEKGAIRFHLPGRIQHKTTIKVAHFPTGDEKSVVVNVKPDDDDDLACCAPLCANNQNFCVPPCHPPPMYPYPYGYGGCDPYTSYYYGCGSYPPYY